MLASLVYIQKIPRLVRAILDKDFHNYVILKAIANKPD
jgi:hypothetical protein